MARLRDEYEKFTQRGAEVLAVGPDGSKAFAVYWKDQRLPFIGLPDPAHKVALQYRQQVKLFKWGRMPLVTVIDPQGAIRYVHYGTSMSDIPTNATLLAVVDEIREASG